MALGDTYNNNDDKKTKNVNTYSMVNFANPEGVDKTKLSFDFWGNLMKVSIAPVKESKGNGYNEYDHENAGKVYLTHMKARQLAAIISRYPADPVGFPDNAGVNTKDSVVVLHKTLNGSTGPCLVIKKFNESGQMEASFAYEFKNDFHYAVENFEDLEKDYDKVFDNELELASVCAIFAQFAETINGALAPSVLEYGKFDQGKVMNGLYKIADKLGVQLNGGYSNGGGQKTDVFSGSGTSKPGRRYSIDDID